VTISCEFVRQHYCCAMILKRVLIKRHRLTWSWSWHDTHQLAQVIYIKYNYSARQWQYFRVSVHQVALIAASITVSLFLSSLVLGYSPRLTQDWYIRYWPCKLRVFISHPFRYHSPSFHSRQFFLILLVSFINLLNFLDTVNHLHFTLLFVFTSSRYHIIF